MTKCVLRARWGLGPRIDPHFDARVGRAAVGIGLGQQSSELNTGYIEFLGVRPYDYLEALFELLYGQPPSGAHRFYKLARRLNIHDRPHVWTQIRALRYLTTDYETGVALPLHDFNPDTDAPGWSDNAGTKLRAALDRLNAITEQKLHSASMIGLTVTFQYGVLAESVQQVLRPSLLRRTLALNKRRQRAKIEQILFGGANPFFGAFGRAIGRRVGARQFDAQDLAASTGLSPQLKRAIKELRDGSPQVPPDGDLTYGISETGRNVVVGIVDFGCDFAHPSFCGGALENESRILALWDQNSEQELVSEQQPIVTPEPATASFGQEKCRFGFGRLFTKEHIDLVLKTWRETCPHDKAAPYRMLGYDPHDHHYTSKRPGPNGAPYGAHGTMVLEVAAGGRRRACRLGGNGSENAMVRGVAAEAKIVFVQVRLHKQEDGRRILDANDVIDGVAFVFHIANQYQLPAVVNLSLNTMSGPHDGDGHFERRLANLLRALGAGPDIKGRAVVIAAGNLPASEIEGTQWQHLNDSVSTEAPFEFFWLRPSGADMTRNSLEIWYDPDQAWLRVSLVSPAGESFGPIAPGQAAELLVDGCARGCIIGSRIRPAIRDNDPLKSESLPKDDTSAGRHVILLELDPQLAIEGCWRVLLEAVDRTHGPLQSGAAPSVPFHVWLERDDDGQSGISRTNPPTSIPLADRASTIGTLSCGEDAIVVGAYDTYASVATRWGLSGHGPRRNGGVRKPDICAPGHNILLIRSKMADTNERCALGTGTSMAAPFVTGTIACMYEAAPHARLSTVKKALISTTRTGFGNTGDPWSPEFGYGRLNPAAALAWFKSNLQPEDVSS